MLRPEEFLNSENGYINKQAIKGLYPVIKDTFITIANNIDYYDYIIIDGASRTGKTLLLELLNIYLVLKPYEQSLSKNNIVYELYFEKNWGKIRSINDNLRKSLIGNKWKKEHINSIVYTTNAYKMIEINPVAIVHSNFMFSLCNKGISESTIIESIKNSHERLKATTHGPVIIINEPECLKITEFVESIKLNPKTYYTHFTRWEVNLDRVPVYKHTGETFKVFIGEKSIPAMLINDDNNGLLNCLSQGKIREIPIDYKMHFEQNLHKSIQDILGLPLIR